MKSLILALVSLFHHHHKQEPVKPHFDYKVLAYLLEAETAAKDAVVHGDRSLQPNIDAVLDDVENIIKNGPESLTLKQDLLNLREDRHLLNWEQEQKDKISPL